MRVYGNSSRLFFFFAVFYLVGFFSGFFGPPGFVPDPVDRPGIRFIFF